MSAIPSPSLSTGPVVPSMMQPEGENARPDTAASSTGARNDQRFPRVAFICCLLFGRKLLSRTGTDPRAIHQALRRTSCDKLHRLYLGGLTANHLSQYRCRRLYLKRGERNAVRSRPPPPRLRYLFAAVGFGDVERRRPVWRAQGKSHWACPAQGAVARNRVPGSVDALQKQPHLCDRRVGTPTVGDGVARLRSNHPADLDSAAVDLHAGSRQTRRTRAGGRWRASCQGALDNPA